MDTIEKNAKLYLRQFLREISKKNFTDIEIYDASQIFFDNNIKDWIKNFEAFCHQNLDEQYNSSRTVDLEDYGKYIVKGNQGGGDCFYRAVSNSIFNNENYINSFRLAVLHTIFLNFQVFENMCGMGLIEDAEGNNDINTIQKLYLNVCTIGQWATNAAVYSLTLFSKRLVFIHSKTEFSSVNLIYHSDEMVLGLNPILLYRTQLPTPHYETLFPFSQNYLRFQKLLDKNLPNKENVSQIMKNFDPIREEQDFRDLTFSESQHTVSTF